MAIYVRFVAALLCAAGALAVPARATAPQPQTLEMAGHLTGPSTIAGTWTGAGFVDDAGTYTQTFRFAGNTIHDEKVLVGSKGTIVIRVQAVVVWLSPCTATFEAGSWRIVDGTGAYERLKGGGAPATAPGSFGDVCTGTIEIIHTGEVHAD